jgi:hypothetical protein
MPPSTPRHPAYSSYRITRNSDRNSPSNRLGGDDDPDIPDNIDKPILALNYKGKYLGGAYWKHNDSTLVILGDIPCVDVADMLDLGIP